MAEKIWDKKTLATELLLKEMEISDSLSGEDITIIKTPTPSFYIGYPFNAHCYTLEELERKVNEKGWKLSNPAKGKIASMESYQIITLQKDDKVLKPIEVNYLYSVPSWAAGGVQFGTTNT